MTSFSSPLSYQSSEVSNDEDEKESRLQVVRSASNRSGAPPLVKIEKLGHRRVFEDGEITYKKFETTGLMGSIQLGIRQSLEKLKSLPERDLLMQDFVPIDHVTFSRDGFIHKTPAHNYTEFRFKTFAPVAFRTFRKMFEINQEIFRLSTVCKPMIELANPGVSGSIFYLTSDDNFILKTVQHKEAEFLRKLLPGYYLNLQQNKRTLLPKFFGLYCYSCNAKNVRIVIMNNLLPSGLKMHHRFDLKGSTYKRKAAEHERAKKSPTFKDLDFLEMYPEGIYLESEIYDNLMNSILRDCRVLESFKIMDYSLLIGIHNCESENRFDYLEFNDGQSDDKFERTSSFVHRERIIAHSTALESITMDAYANPEMNDEESGVRNAWGGIPAKNIRGDNLLLFIGIIDILQEYGAFKKVEHYWKALIHDGDTVSVTHPKFYASRFQSFMKDHVFKKYQTPTANPKNRGFKGKERIEDSVSGVTVITIGDSKKSNSEILNVLVPSISSRKEHLKNRNPSITFSYTNLNEQGFSPSTTTENEPGSILMTSDERVQIYVPSPSGKTPTSTSSSRQQTYSTNRDFISKELGSPIHLSEL